MTDQRLQDRNGEAIQDDDGFLLPHFRTFAAVWNTFTRTYRYSWDEAIKHSPTNALTMRRDAFVMGCLQERYLQVAQLPWHLEPENARDPNQSVVASALTDILKATDRWHHFTMQLSEAIWYGRFANQVRWDAGAVNGQTRLVVTDHRPVNGDKIQFGFDGTPRIMVHAADATKLPGAADAIVFGDRGPMLELKDPRWRQRFVIHKHIPSDADYFEGEMAGGVHGVGLRSQIYWLWWVRQEMLGWAVNHLKKIGVGGILIFYYEEGNDAGKKSAEAAAKDAGDQYALAMPRPRGTSRGVTNAELLPFNEAGVQSLTAIISDYFERHIERLIIGQSLSSKAQGTGMGSSVADLHADTKFRILKFDAENLADTLTRDLVAVAQRWNFPGLGFRVRLAFDIPQPDAKDKLDAASKLYAMKVPLRANDIRGAAGFGKPQPGDEVIGAPPQEPPSHGLGSHAKSEENSQGQDESDAAEPFQGDSTIDYALSNWVKFDENGRRIAWSQAVKRPKGEGWRAYTEPQRRSKEGATHFVTTDAPEDENRDDANLVYINRHTNDGNLDIYYKHYKTKNYVGTYNLLTRMVHRGKNYVSIEEVEAEGKSWWTTSDWDSFFRERAHNMDPSTKKNLEIADGLAPRRGEWSVATAQAQFLAWLAVEWEATAALNVSPSSAAQAAETTRAVTTVNDASGITALLGRDMGKPLEAKEVQNFIRNMAKKGITVETRPEVVNEVLMAKQAAGFQASSKTIFLRPSATYHEAFHEFLHARQFLQNEGAYRALNELEKEKYVFYNIRSSKFWDTMTKAQRDLAESQLTKRGSTTIGWENWFK